VPGTPLHAATRYAINQEAAWRLCFSDVRFEIDNGEKPSANFPVPRGDCESGEGAKKPRVVLRRPF
jgi:hypothetical protein